MTASQQRLLDNLSDGNLEKDAFVGKALWWLGKKVTGALAKGGAKAGGYMARDAGKTFSRRPLRTAGLGLTGYFGGSQIMQAGKAAGAPYSSGGARNIFRGNQIQGIPRWGQPMLKAAHEEEK